MVAHIFFKTLGDARQTFLMWSNALSAITKHSLQA